MNCLSAYEDRIAAVVLSMTLPGMESFSMLNIILREKEVWKFAVITTAADVQLERKALELGADDFITKSRLQDVLRIRVKRAMQLNP